MIKEHYSILFCSLTGNTKKLADAIYETLPKDKCDYFGTNDSQVPQSDVCYIGFWTDKGNADQKTLELLSKLKNKKIFLFGTAGFGGSDAYFEKILGQVKQSIDASNTVIGEYIFKRFSDRSGSPLIQAIPLSENICVREKCRSLCGSAM